MKSVFLRFYSAINLGDDLFVKIIAERYNNKFFMMRARNKYLTNVSDNLYTGSFMSLIIRKIRLKIRLSKWLDEVDAESRKFPLHVHIGGSLFIENTGGNKWQQEVTFYSNLAKPYYILGSNVGPYNSEGFLSAIESIFKHAKDVCFRDSTSYDLYKHLSNVRLASDVAFTLKTDEYIKSHTEIQRVIFSIIDAYEKFDKQTADLYEKELMALTKSLIKQGEEVIYMSFCKQEGDERAIRRILRLLPKSVASLVKVHYYRGDINKSLEEIASSSIIIASRFHASILGLLFGKKVLPMAYSNKTTDILRDMNFKGPMVDIRRIDDFNGAEFDFNQLQINDISGQIKLAEKQFQELDKVLTKRNNV